MNTANTMQKITIKCTTGERDVDAIIIGAWAAHESVDGHGWSVTLVEHGRRCGIDLDKRSAVKLARVLNERLPVFRWSGVADEMPHAEDIVIARAAIAEFLP